MDSIKSLPGYLWLLIATILFVAAHCFIPADTTINNLISMFAGATLTAFYKEAGIIVPGMKAKVFKPIVKHSGTAALILCALFLSACAHTDFYAVNSQGKSARLAHFEGDMLNSKFSYAGNGVKISWTSDNVSHSSATLAQGAAANNVMHGAATLGTAAGMAVATSGMLPGGIAGIFK